MEKKKRSNKKNLKGGFKDANVLHQYLIMSYNYIPEEEFDKLCVIISKLVVEQNLGGTKLNNLYNDKIDKIIDKYNDLNIPKNINEGFVIVEPNKNIKLKNNKTASSNIDKIFKTFELKTIKPLNNS